MQDTGHFNPNFLGGQFRWWVGQVAPAKHWKGNSTRQLEKKANRIPGWGYRYKVRIIGLHDRDEAVLPSEQLPWAQVMYGVTDGGGQRGQLTTPAIAQGNFVFGFFLDGDEEQVPIIMGILGHNQKTKIKTTEVVNYGASCAWDDEGVIAGDSTILGNKDNYKSEDNNNEESNNGENNNEEGNNTTNTNGQGGESGDVSNVIKQGVDATDLVTSGDNKQKDILTKKHHVDCAVKGQKPEMKGIQLAIKNMSDDIAKIQKALNDFPTAISIPIVKLETEIDDIVDKYTGDITKHMNTVLNKVEHFSLESLTNKLIDKIAEAPSGDAKKLSKEQLQRRKTLACVLGKTKGQLGNLIKAGIGRMLARRKNRSGGGENQFVGNGSNLIPPVAPDGYYYPNNPCETEEFVSEIMADTLGTMFETMNQTQETTVGSVGSSTVDGSSGGRGLLGSITDLGQGVSGALGKLNSLSDLSVGSLLPLGALGGPLANLSGSLNKLSGFGALDPTNFDVALAMSFVSVISAFSECIPKPSCSENDATTLDGGGESEKDEINAANVSKELNDKISPSNKSVFDNLTEGQKNRILNAPIGTNIEGVNVDEKVKFELRQYEMSNSGTTDVGQFSDTGVPLDDAARNLLFPGGSGEVTNVGQFSDTGVPLDDTAREFLFGNTEITPAGQFSDAGVPLDDTSRNLVSGSSNTFETPTFNKPPLSFNEYRASLYSGNTRGFYDIPTDAVVNTKAFIVSEDRAYQLLSELDDYQGDNTELLEFKTDYNKGIYQKVYGGTGISFEYNGKTYKPGDDDYNKTFLEVKNIINRDLPMN